MARRRRRARSSYARDRNGKFASNGNRVGTGNATRAAKRARNKRVIKRVGKGVAITAGVGAVLGAAIATGYAGGNMNGYNKGVVAGDRMGTIRAKPHRSANGRIAKRPTPRTSLNKYGQPYAKRSA